MYTYLVHFLAHFASDQDGIGHGDKAIQVENNDLFS